MVSVSLGFLALTQTGCVSMSSLQTAETLPPGKTQTTYGGGYYQSDALGKGTEDFKMPYFELSYREGLSDNWDVGAKLTLIGSGVFDAKYRFFDGENFDAAIGLGVGYLSVSTSTGSSTTSGGGATDDNKSTTRIIDGILPLYASYKFHENFSTYISPRFVQRWTNSESSSSSASLGGGAFGFKIGKNWGVYTEVGYQKELGGGDFSAMQYNLAFFSESDGGVLKGLGL